MSASKVLSVDMGIVESIRKNWAKFYGIPSFPPPVNHAYYRVAIIGGGNFVEVRDVHSDDGYRELLGQARTSGTNFTIEGIYSVPTVMF